MAINMGEVKRIFEIVESGDIEALKQCISQNPKALGEVNEAGVPALHLLVETGNLEFVKFAIEYSIVNPCIVDKQGNTILHYGVKSGSLELVKYLVERVGVPIDRANLLGETAFDLAHRMGGGVAEEFVVSENKVPGVKRLEVDARSGAGVLQRQGEARSATFQGARADICEYLEQTFGCTMDELYHNPIRRGMHPDPSIVRVGEDYYMVNSSFMFFPCIPVSHSRDLLHWEVIGHAITNPDWARLKGLEGGRGYWAPDISYYEGRFYITATYRMNDGGEKLRYQMVTSSDKPEGPYCEPVFLDEDGIDPSIFTDVDGKRYMLLNRGARIFEISPDGRQILSKPKLLWYGDNKKASEGPHILRKDGYYYLFMAEGGTGMGHRISVARSRTLMGVYESCPYNPILRQWDEERQLQCCGHGKPVQTPAGDWYMVYLCYRYGTSGYGILGRETAMDPITWTADGWPMVNSLKGPSDLQRKPGGGVSNNIYSSGRNLAEGQRVLSENACGCETNGGIAWSRELFNEWSTVRGAKPGSYETVDGRIVIHGNGLDLNTLDYGTILVKPQMDFTFEMSCKVAISIEEHRQNTVGKNCDDWDAGLTCYYDENSYLKLALACRHGEIGILAAEYVNDRYVTDEFIPLEAEGKNVEEEIPEQKADRDKPAVELRIVTDNLKRSCYYRLGATSDLKRDWQQAATFENTAYLSSEGLSKGKRFTGAMAGIYVHGNVTGIFGNFRD